MESGSLRDILAVLDHTGDFRLQNTLFVDVLSHFHHRRVFDFALLVQDFHSAHNPARNPVRFCIEQRDRLVPQGLAIIGHGGNGRCCNPRKQQQNCFFHDHIPPG
ncbi:hypothetical protein JXA40_03120 [bacterium]|nr:hypothetical protein [candidate division CSSED10-310 bacterium]